jgi:hypothetical protein
MRIRAERITIKRGRLRKKSSWVASGAVVSVVTSSQRRPCLVPNCARAQGPIRCGSSIGHKRHYLCDPPSHREETGESLKVICPMS